MRKTRLYKWFMMKMLIRVFAETSWWIGNKEAGCITLFDAIKTYK